ncbi:MAG TPA: Yip1 family protein [Xanthobacteraceae bacterium]|nr:Yip1 family protein [Xanthobacteraceae bacterium]
MNAFVRAKAILVDPAAAWRGIEKDIGDPAYLLSRYVAVLALIPALSSFVGATLIGVVTPSGVLLADLIDGLFGAIFSYATSCAIVLLLGLIIDLLAPLFGGRRDFEDAFKLAVYSFTPLWLAGIFLLLPGLHFLLLTGVYGVYLFWLGAPRLTKVPEQQAANFTAVGVVCACGLLYAAALAQRMLFGTPGL